MATEKTIRDLSRLQYTIPEKAETITNEQLIVGCLQRIADSNEIMSSNYTKLLHDVEHYKELAYNRAEEINRLIALLNAEKAAKSRFKNKLIKLLNKNNHDVQPETQESHS